MSMNHSTTPTPRTEIYVLNPHPPCVPADFARELERELTEKTNEVARLRELLNRAIQIAEALKYSIETEFDAWSIPCRGVLEKYNTLKSDLARLAPAPEEADHLRDATKMPPQEWWNTQGLRHYVPGESFEDAMKWAYSQGQQSR